MTVYQLISDVFFLIFAAIIQTGCTQENLAHKKKILMGTFVEISCISKNRVAGERSIDKTFQEIERIEDMLSNFKASSDISRLNNAGGDLVKVRKETLELVKKAKLFYEASGGAFDITVAPILRSWGFYNKDKDLNSPTALQIEEKLVLVGSDKIIVSESNNEIGFKVAGMAIDLGGIAKGYAVDQAKEVLLKTGIKNALINAGGDIFCLGEGRGKRGWKIGIQHPLKSDEIIATLNLKNKAIATSGSYENFVQIQNRRFGHIINPKTGYPVENDLLSVTVVADDCLTADALATAVFVLDEEEGIKLLKKFAAEAILISKTDKGLGFSITEGLKQNLMQTK